jgi:outer membrane protein assembly factor BamB
MKISKTTIRIALAGLVLATSASVAAVTTQSFVLDSADAFFEGEVEGAAVHSDGSVRPGAATERIEIENVPLAYSVAQRGGLTFIGTGTNGVVYRFDGKKVKAFANTGELLVSSLAFGSDGALYAGTLPNGRIYRIDTKSAKMKRFSIPKGAKHIWALRYDKKRGRLIAGTGPEGRLFAIDPIGRAKELYKAEASHIMTLAGDGKGTIYAGTSDDALVLRIRPDNEVDVVHDFPGNEVTAIDYHDGRLAVAANKFKTAPGSQFKATVRPAATSTTSATPARPATRPRPGSGELWRVDGDGRAEMLVSRKDTHFTAVQWGTDGAIYAGGGHEGRIFRVEPDASYSIWVDVEERQVLALDLRAKNPSFVTGDAAAIYRARSGTRRDAVWTSKALDASFASKWGRLTWRGRGRFVFQTRSGNTQEPGETWSAWSKDLKRPRPITSPAGRFIQVRAKFPKNDSAVLRAVELFYLPQNQRARVSNVQGSRPPLKHGETTRQPPPPTTVLNLTWKVENPDRDPLRYRIDYRKDGQPRWRDMFDEDVVLSEEKYSWDTGSIPDGYYVVRVEASDEPSNPDKRTLRSSATSEPIRVDNHPPRIERLEVRKGRVQGRVVDEMGPIARIQMSIDAGAWRDVFPTDSLLDSASEGFDVPLGDLSRDAHIIAVRAFDASGNQANREITVKTRR